jgi:dTDP-4-amino-4,6-dideoxygalactose transaminase
LTTTKPSHSVYTVRVLDRRRDALARALSLAGIETAVHYPTPLHRQEAIVSSGYGLSPGTLPTAELAASEVLSLPMYPELSTAARDEVVSQVRAFFGSAGAVGRT